MTKATLNETTYYDTDLLGVIAAAGAKYKEANEVFYKDEGIHSGNMWLGPVPIYYLDEIIGFLRMEDTWVNFHTVNTEEKG